MIHYNVLGPLQVEPGDDGTVPDNLLWKKAVALVAYLAHAPGGAESRERLVDLIWPASDVDAGKHGLREYIRITRRALGEDAVVREGDLTKLSSSAVSLDTTRLMTLRDAGEWSRAACLVRGDFLEGFSLPGARDFDEWLARERLTWRRLSVDTLVRAAQEAIDAGDLESAVQFGERAVALDAAAETATRVVMRALALSGFRGPALERFEALEAALRELGTEADPDTRNLAAQVRNERVWRGGGARPAKGPSHRRPPLIGRESVLGPLLGAWRDAAAGERASLVVIEGDPGTGKTRLLEELTARARLDGACVSMVRAVPADLDTECAAVVGSLRGGLAGGSGLASLDPTVLGACVAAFPEWAANFPGVKPVPLDGSPSGLLSHVVSAVVHEQPVVLAIDDSHWLDAASSAALQTLLRDCASAPLLLVLVTPRSSMAAAVESLRSRIGRDYEGDVFSLDGFDEPELRSLIAWAFPEVDNAQRDRIYRRVRADSAGIPLLAVELASAAAHGLNLGTETTPWPAPFRTLEHTMPADLPPTVVGATRIGYRRLDADAQLVLQVMAVAGERIAEDDIAACCDLPLDRARRALDSLEWDRWIVTEPRGYGYTARIVREIVSQDMVTDGQRRRFESALRSATGEAGHS